MNEKTPRQTELDRCVCCGQPVTNDGELCAACEAQLEFTPVEPINGQEEVEADLSKKPRTQLLNLAEHPNAFKMVNGFSYPDWELVRDVIDRKVAESESGEAWRDAVAQWLDRLCLDLGADYSVRMSGNFVLLSCVSERRADLLFIFMEQTLGAIAEELGSAASVMGAGQYPILLFNDGETFDRYLRYFYSNETERMLAATNGVCLYGGYVHIALPIRILRELKRMLAHELTHATTYHLPSPMWLSEGLAMNIERTITGEPPILASHELVSALRSFWTEKNIQTFWSGESFGVPGASQELSYAFAEALFGYLHKNGKDIINFLKVADHKDAGQAAAINLLDTDLNDAVVEFLGPGEWRPDSEAIASFYRTAGWE